MGSANGQMGEPWLSAGFYNPSADPYRADSAFDTAHANPFDPPPGCAFHARCPHADGKCRSQLPDFRQIGEKHMVACHHAEEHCPTKPT